MIRRVAAPRRSGSFASGAAGAVVIVGVVAVVAVLSLLVGGCTTRDQAAVAAAPRIADHGFERAASAVCKTAAQAFDVMPTLPKEATGPQSADLIVKIDATFAAMVTQLRALPVADPGDRTAVQGWLADWDQYVSFGQTYAASLRTGTERDLVASQQAAQGTLRRRIQAFATANSMPACHFQ